MLPSQITRNCETISTAIYDWLAAEVESSSEPTDVNVVLNDHTKALEGLRGGFEHKYNFTWNKHQGHMDRLDVDVNTLQTITPEDPDFDKFAARISFYGLMEFSGGYRNQCYVEADDQDDYMARRRKVVGISIANTVKNRLTDLIPYGGGFEDARISIEGLSKDKDKLIEADTKSKEEMIGMMVQRADTSLASAEMIKSQALYLTFITDVIILIAKAKKGQLAEVPFMEPRSISEQSGKLWYPLKQPLDWAAIMAQNPPALKPGGPNSF